MSASRRPLGLAAVTVAAAALAAGCQSSSGGGTTTTPPPPPATSSAPAAATGTSACSDLVVSGQALVTTVTQFVSGQATGDQVRASATQLGASIDAARSSAGSQASGPLNDAKAALQRLQTAITAQPPDISGVRTAAGDTLAALRSAASACQPGTASPTSS